MNANKYNLKCIVKNSIKSNIKKTIVKSKKLSNIYFANQDAIKIHGSFKVGSNYLKKLLENNFEGRILIPTDFGWKHGKIIYYSHFKYIILAKSPFSWVLSLWNWEKLHEQTNEKTLSKFIMSDKSSIRWQNEWSSVNIIDAWNKSYNMYFNYFDEDNVIFVRYEDLITDFQRTLEYIGHSLSLSSKIERFVDYKERADNFIKPDKRKKLDINFYKNKKYLEEIDKDSIAFMIENLDHELINRMGYSLDLVYYNN